MKDFRHTPSLLVRFGLAVFYNLRKKRFVTNTNCRKFGEQMKLPKETKRYCPKCKKHTSQTVGTAKQKSRSSTRPLSRGSRPREILRGLVKGTGNKGRRSRKGPKDWKRKTKVTRRLTVEYKCKECKKTSQIKKAIRAGRIEVGDKVAK